MSARLNRRYFLMGATGLAGTAALHSPRQARAADKVRVGVIGCGGQGEYNWGQVGAQEDLVDVRMICDVDLARTANAAKRFPNAEVVQDFRRVIDRKDIDAVVISTPDHWHAIPSVWAIDSGKHVYCEKPLGRSIYEVRKMTEIAKNKGAVTQMGTQIHAGGNYRRVVELIRTGAIGTVRRVDVWVGSQPTPGRRTANGTPPPTLDYKLWQGPCEPFPYNPAIVPFHWRWWFELAGGVLADLGCHYMDLAYWALDLPAPSQVTATGIPFDKAVADNTVPVKMQVDYLHTAGPAGSPVQLTWWHGVSGPRDANGEHKAPHGYGAGVLFSGDRGQLLSDYSRHMLLPEDRFKDFPRPSKTIPDSVGHHREWLLGIRDGTPTTCDWSYSGPLTEAVLLGNVAYQLGKPIEWDSRKLKIKNVREREWKRLIRPEYHGGWELKR